MRRKENNNTDYIVNNGQRNQCFCNRPVGMIFIYDLKRGRRRGSKCNSAENKGRIKRNIRNQPAEDSRQFHFGYDFSARRL